MDIERDNQRRNLDATLQADVGAALAIIPGNTVRYEIRDDGIVYLAGIVGSEEQRTYVEQLVRDVSGVRDVANDIDVAASEELATNIIADNETFARDMRDNELLDRPWIADPGQDEPQTGTDETGRAVSAHTTDMPTQTDVMDEHRSQDTQAEDASPNAIAMYDTDLQQVGLDVTSLEMEPDFTDDVGTTDPKVAVQEGEPYFPPTDPVLLPDPALARGFEEVGGVASVADTPEQMLGNDEDIEERVRYELRRNAMTADLRIRVRVREGIVTLRGRVSSIEEVEEAEAVAAGVEGVIEVNEELEIEI